MNKLHLKGPIFLFSLVLLLFSCSDDFLKVGLEILPDSDILEADADTIPIECFTFKGLPGYANSSTAADIFIPIGQVYDSVFGETTAEVTLEVLYDSDHKYIVKTDSINEIISLKLYLNTTDSIFYGDENISFDIDFYPLNSRYSYGGSTSEMIPSDYFDNIISRTVSTSHNASIDTNNPPPTLDTLKSYTIIELDNELAEILTDINIKTEADFYNALPGFLLRPKALTNTIGSLQNFYPNKSKLILEYKQTYQDVNDEDSVVVKHASYNVTNYKNTYRNNHTGRNAEIESVFRDTVNQSDKIYLQGLGGTRAMIKVNYLESFRNRHLDSIGINLAELVFPINKEYSDDIAQFKLPDRIWIHGISSDIIFPVPDEKLGDYYYGGYLDIENSEYRVNISEYVNYIMLEKYGDQEYFLLNMMISEDFSKSPNPTVPYYLYPARVVLNSGLESNVDKAYLRIVYTHL